MSANADFSTLLKCLASGKKSIEQLRPSAPRQTSARELLVVYCFRILLVYPCALYHGMLILSRALGACPTPLLGSQCVCYHAGPIAAWIGSAILCWIVWTTGLNSQYTHCNLAFLAKRGNFKFLCVASLQTVHQGYNSLYKQLVQSSIHCFVLTVPLWIPPHPPACTYTAANRKMTTKVSCSTVV